MSIPTKDSIFEALRQVIDPEIGCNLVDLGLIYDVVIDGSKVAVKMMVTTPGCPMHQSMAMGAQNALLNAEGVEEASVEVIWDPPWTPDRMTKQARIYLGMESADSDS